MLNLIQVSQYLFGMYWLQGIAFLSFTFCVFIAPAKKQPWVASLCHSLVPSTYVELSLRIRWRVDYRRLYSTEPRRCKSLFCIFFVTAATLVGRRCLQENQQHAAKSSIPKLLIQIYNITQLKLPTGMQYKGVTQRCWP